jgi:hypothetical protein
LSDDVKPGAIPMDEVFDPDRYFDCLSLLDRS